MPPPSDAVDRLKWYEARNKALTARRQRDTVEHTLNRDTILQLRMQLTPEQAVEYARG